MNTIVNKVVKKSVLGSLILSLGIAPIAAEAHGGGWVLPALLGGAILYDVTRPHYDYPPQTVYVQPQTVYVQPQPYYVQPQPYYVQPVPTYSYAPPAPVYQQAPAAAAAPQSWHYCSSAKGYYPYVKVCPGGWEQVPAMPPAAMQ